MMRVFHWSTSDGSEFLTVIAVPSQPSQRHSDGARRVRIRVPVISGQGRNAALHKAVRHGEDNGDGNRRQRTRARPLQDRPRRNRSKYIGETERNLNRIFAAADEAEAL